MGSKPVVITDRMLQNLKPGKRTIRDAVVPGFAIRVSNAGGGTGVLIKRPREGENSTKIKLGRVGRTSLADMRAEARRCIELISQGIDPREEAKKAEEAERERQASTFGAAFEEFLKRPARGKRRAHVVERNMRRELLSKWTDTPLSDITHREITSVIEAIRDRGAETQAHHVFSHAGLFFKWAYRREKIDRNPMDRVLRSDILPPRRVRQRFLRDNELPVYVRAARRMPYPTGPLLYLLVLTGGRKMEVAGARWSELHPDFVRIIRDHQERQVEVDWSKVPNEIKFLQVPPARFKSNATHLIALSDDACRVIEHLPTWPDCDLLFSTNGKKPPNGWSATKRALDQRMLRTMRALARMRGEDPDEVALEGFVLHDVRRTVRTNLSALKVPHEIAELIVGHAKQGLTRVYNVFEHREEMADAMQQWAQRLRQLSEPRPVSNVVKLRART